MINVMVLIDLPWDFARVRPFSLRSISSSFLLPLNVFESISFRPHPFNFNTNSNYYLQFIESTYLEDVRVVSIDYLIFASDVDFHQVTSKWVFSLAWRTRAECTLFGYYSNQTVWVLCCLASLNWQTWSGHPLLWSLSGGASPSVASAAGTFCR